MCNLFLANPVHLHTTCRYSYLDSKELNVFRFSIKVNHISENVKFVALN